MKKIIHFCLLLGLALTLHVAADAQVRKIPSVVTEAFRSKYPTALNVEWRDRLSGFTAAFDLDNIHYEAKFTNKGFWENTENKIAEADIPAPIKDGFDKSKYAEEWKIKRAYKIALKEDKIQYRLEIEKSELQKKQLFFDPNGRLLRDNIIL